MSHTSALIVTDIEQYLHQHERKGLPRFIALRLVDDGKTTMTARLLVTTSIIWG